MARTGRLNQNSAYDMGQVPPNSFDSEYQNQDPFYASSNTALPSNVQMAVTSQEQSFLVLQQQQQQSIWLAKIQPILFGNPFEVQKSQLYPAQSSNHDLTWRDRINSLCSKSF
ncbi:hypothetical protein OIU78_024014 [Salix suchowensis]|nr:hypothetical protein OIU78_024014 [Salix suchowensis]